MNKQADGLDPFLKTDGGKTKSNAIQVPSIELPQGGGAIRGIDEKLTVNAVNGTASFSIPLPFSPARGASPSLALSYNSGGGNGIFGLGWDLGLACIQRKTGSELPQYLDAIDSDAFLFSEAEDLVCAFRKNDDGSFPQDAQGDYLFEESDSPDGLFTIRLYRPRIEGLFARIERWTRKTSGEIRWRVITRENTTTLFGWTAQARIADPQNATRIFKWLPELVFDDKGNCAHYLYAHEDDAGFDPLLPHNRNRRQSGQLTYTNTYLSRVLYGNQTPYQTLAAPFVPETDYLFETAFDYGDYNPNAPFDRTGVWDLRPDAFSDHRAGFEIRTTRLCKRALLFHRFKEEEYNGLVRSLDFEYDTSAEQDFTFLKSITSHGYIRKPDGSYSSKGLPPFEFHYQKHEWKSEVKAVSQDALAHAPAGIDGSAYQFVDLFNEGLAGILSEQATGWYYKHNLGLRPTQSGNASTLVFEKARLVSSKPSFSGLGAQLHLADLDADGGKQIVNYAGEPKGFFELDDENQWQPLRNFRELPNVDFSDPFTRMIDMNGDGKAELVISEDNVFTWYQSEGRNGFKQARKTAKPFDEEKGPALVFADRKQTVFLADMSGDGLTDIVRIRHSEVCYWPNLGYGRFGAKITMDNAPLLDGEDHFNPAYIRLADIDGSGTADIVYLGKNKFSCWKNLSGNRFSAVPFELPAFAEIHAESNVTVTDLLGNGLACIVWSSPLAKDAGAPLRYVDLMNGRKPHIMVAYRNNMGKEVSLEYTPSTRFYIEDKLGGKPWVTKLHFPVHCVSKVTTQDRITGHTFSSSYSYHHGYYDHFEREFRGFGRVDQTDAETFEHWVKPDAVNLTAKDLDQDPVLARQWFHTGAFPGNGKILNQFEHEYWYNQLPGHGFPVVHHEKGLAEAIILAAKGVPQSLADKLSAEEYRQALRACKGMALRSEVFALDAVRSGNTGQAKRKELTPYTVTAHNCVIELLQPKGNNRHAVFIARESQTITYHYERDTEDPRITHTLNIRLDEYGNVLESAFVAYPRRTADASLPPETQAAQDETSILYTLNRFTNDAFDEDSNRQRLLAEVQTFDLKGVSKTGEYYLPSDFENILDDANSSVALYHELNKPPVAGKAQRRLIEHIKKLYYKNDLTASLPLLALESKAIGFESYQLAYTPELISDIFAARVNDALLQEGKFAHGKDELNNEDANWWIRSGTMQYMDGGESAADARNRFYVPVSYTEPFGALTRVKYYSAYWLLIEETEDALSNKATVASFNFRTLSPRRMRDPNANLSEVLTDELGLVKAMAVFGKGNQADDLEGLKEETDAAETALVQGFLDPPATASGVTDSAALIDAGRQLLQNATVRFVYDFDTYRNSGKPAVAASVLRETHARDENGSANPLSKLQLSFEYSSGSGRVAMKKVQAQPGNAKRARVQSDGTLLSDEVDTTPLLRWIGNGKTVLNNKGNAVKQYEPYFSVSHRYEDFKELAESGVTSIMYYDAVGRLARTQMPDGSFSKVEFDSWKQLVHDANDTVLDSDWYKRRTDNSRPDFIIDAKEQQAATKASLHANTPRQLHVDTLGRPVLSIEHNRNMTTNADEFLYTKVDLDIEGNLRLVTDHRANAVMQYRYDMLGNTVYGLSMDAGRRWLLTDILGNPLRTWDERNHEFQYHYDILHRPLRSTVIGGDRAAPLNNVFDFVIYGESQPDPEQKNLRGKIYKHFDTAGLLDMSDGYDFKGKPKQTKRKLFSKYKQIANWTAANLSADLEADEFVFITQTDAIGRILRQTAPDGSILTFHYNETGLLKGESVLHPGAATAQEYIAAIDYNQKGQRERIRYGNNAITRFAYEKETFRLRQLISRRQDNSLLQDLSYTYDAVGNVTHLQDKAIPTVFFDNMRIEPACTYTYDALYRLIEASGRENNAALNFGACDNWNDSPFMRSLNPGDPMAMRNYTQRYRYDSVGNIMEIKHLAPGSNWTRGYEYENTSNRLKRTFTGGNGSPASYTAYTHHSRHGFMVELPHLEKIDWNFKEEVVLTCRQHCTDDTIPVITYYQYDGAGQRIRKITENQAAAGGTPTKREERIYIAGYELFKKHTGSDAGLERVSLSLIHGDHRFAMIETRNNVNDGTGEQLVRYQLHNHLGSSALELDTAARVISYEEYHPYGTTAYQAKNAAVNSAAKRYRYTGMERDEETGLGYHSARYYLPWLGRWLSSDPKGLVDGTNLYQYSHNSPTVLSDVAGTEPKRPYQFGLGFDESGLTGDPRADSEANTNLTLLSVGGFNALTSGSSHTFWQILVGLGPLYSTVFSHEGGHYREGVRQNANPDMHFALGLFPYKVSSIGRIDLPIGQAAGVNQNMLNARAMWRNFNLSGGRPSIVERMAYWENQGYLAFYNVKATMSENPTNDVNNYIKNTHASRGVLLGSSLAITGLELLSQIFSHPMESAVGNKIAAPRFEAYLTSSGDPLFGLQTIVRPGGQSPPVEVTINATPTFSDFSFGLKAHDISIPGVKGLFVSPFVSLSGWGVSGGTDVKYNFNPDWGVSLTGGYRDGSNPLNSIEGVQAGWHTNLSAIYRFGRRQ